MLHARRNALCHGVFFTIDPLLRTHIQIYEVLARAIYEVYIVALTGRGQAHGVTHCAVTLGRVLLATSSVIARCLRPRESRRLAHLIDCFLRLDWQATCLQFYLTALEIFSRTSAQTSTTLHVYGIEVPTSR